MKTTLFLCLFTAFICSSYDLLADSPLTSTEISLAYQDISIVKAATKANGVLTPKLMKYLANERKPVDIKIALINELGWDFDGKNNADIFFEYLNKDNTYGNIAGFMSKASGDLLICMAYLKGLDDYFDVAEAANMARKAKEKNNSSYTVNIICALIEAQLAFDTDWCEVYQLTNRVRLNQTLKADMRPEAIKIIFEYMDLYEESC